MALHLPENRILNLAEIERQNTLLESLPSLLFLEITTECNLNCIMCRPNKASVPPLRIMSYRRYQELAAALFSTALRVELCGMGEPTLHPHFLSFIKVCDRFPETRFGLTTNGTMLQGELAHEIAARPVDVTVSIDGCSEQSYRLIRRNDAFRSVIRNLECFLELQRCKSRSEGATIVQITLQRGNIHEFPMFVEFMSDLGVDCISAHQVSSSLFNPVLELDGVEEKARDLVAKAIEVANNRKAVLVVPWRLSAGAVIPKGASGDFML